MVAIIIFICIVFLSAVAVAAKRSPKRKGKNGERRVSRILGGTKAGKQYVINNLLFASDNGHSCQIDHILVNKRGIWVIETKNYSGKIYGGVDQREWTQVLAYGNTKNKFYNPIKQNQTHIYHLSRYLNVKDVFINVVAFSDKADIKKVKSARVINFRKLRKLKNKDMGITLTAEQMENYYNRLTELKNNSKITEKEHIKDIADTQKKIEKGICPRCGGKLVLRKGKYGKFYGCSNYPGCRFTKNMD